MRLLNTIVLFSIIFSLTSCSEDEKPLEKTLFTVAIPSGSLDSHLDTWFFLTDNAGNLLGIQEAVDGLDMSFERPSGFKGEKFSVHKVEYELAPDNSYADFVFTSYTGISEGKIQLQPINISSSPEVGAYSFSITSVPTGYVPSFIGPKISGGSWSGNGGNSNGNVGLLQGNSPLMIWFRNISDRTKVPRYAFINNAIAGGTFSSSFSALNIPEEIIYNFGTSIDRAEFNIHPHISGSGYLGWFEYFSSLNVTSAKVYYPGNTFEKYDTWIRLTDGTQGQTSHTIGAIPATIKALPATIDSFSSEEGKLMVGTTGTYDYLYLYGFTEWLTGVQEHWLTWYIYMDDAAEKTYTVPTFPEILLERYPELNTVIKNFNSVYINDSDNIAGYKEYLQSSWGTTAFPQFTESLSRSRKFSTGARMPFEEGFRSKRK